MLTSTKPRSSPTRATRTPQPPPISYPITAPRPSSQNTITAPASPPKTQPRGRRPSISNTMHWLSRSSTQSSHHAPYVPSKPTRISEPKLVRSIDLLSQPRSGALGSGATIVRTPDDALRETGVRLTFDGKARDGLPASKDIENLRDSAPSEDSGTELPPPTDEYPIPQSPPLPPLPMPEEEESRFLEAEVEDVEVPKPPPRPTRAPPPAPAPSLRPSLKPKSTSIVDEFPSVPPLPVHIPTSPPPSPFEAILVSEVPTGAIDPSKIIVTLETCTATYRTTINTLCSRPSHLANYVASLFARKRDGSATSSIYSTASDDMSTYRYHLASQGLLPQATFNLHIFLDRSSAPYVYIFNYLRSPIGTPEFPETLPRGAQLQSSSHVRLESLLDLRDEAAYLGLEGLHKLCTDEIRLRHGPRLHTRGHSTGGSTHSLHASVYSLHTLLERVESDMKSDRRDSNSSADTKVNKDVPNELAAIRSPPTPQSWNGPPLRERSRTRHSPSRSPPAGWI